ncbi:MAG: ABC transporter permease [Rikenellaceae bacterium]|nr:ABC transporter permease [Rikenellaceae bacterium]
MGKIGIIIQREFNERVRKKSFILTTILTPILFLGIIAAVFYLAGTNLSQTKEIMVVDGSGFVAAGLRSDKSAVLVPTELSAEEIRAAKTAGEFPGLYGILVIGEDIMTNPHAATLYTFEPSTFDIETSLSMKISDAVEAEKLKAYDIEDLPEILAAVKTNLTVSAYRVDESGREKQSSSGLAMGLAYIFGFLIYMFVFLYGMMVMQGVIEEKSSKVLEIIVSSVKPFELMMGKILGIAAVALTQFVIWVVFLFAVGTALLHLFPGLGGGAPDALADGTMADMAAMQGMDPAMFSAIETVTDPSFLLATIGGFLIYFIGGYLLYAAMFAAVGSAVDNAADAQQLQLPITIPMMLAIVVMISVMRDPNSSLAFWFSMIPFTSPVVMVARLPYGVPLWEIALSVALLFATFVAMVWLAGKVYRVGIFMHGKKPSFGELLKWAKYKS